MLFADGQSRYSVAEGPTIAVVVMGTCVVVDGVCDVLASDVKD